MQKKRESRRGGRAPYEYWILRALVDAGGAARVARVYERLLDEMRPQFTKREFAIESYAPTWKIETQWAREDMKRDGRLKAGSPRGIWEISAAGRKWLGDHPTAPKLQHPRPDLLRIHHE